MRLIDADKWVDALEKEFVKIFGNNRPVMCGFAEIGDLRDDDFCSYGERGTNNEA